MVPEEDPEFQIAPMIDILLVLLVFFMTISTSEVLQVRQDIVLPVAKDAKEKKADAAKEGQVVINVLWNELNNSGSVEMDTKNYPDPGLIQGPLEVNAKRSPNMRVLIRADRKVRYDFLRNILKITGAAGVQNVTFSVTDKDSDSKGTPAPTP